MTVPVAPHMTVNDQIAYKRKKYSEARRKNTQAALSALGAGAGAASIGLVTAGKVKKIPRLVEHGFTAGSVGGGIGAVSGATFARNQLREAKEAREDARKMNNTYALRKSLSELSKARRREPPPSEEAWRMSGGRSKDWRRHVSGRARQAYDEPLAPYRAKSKQRKRVSTVLGTSAAAAPVAGLVVGGTKGAVVGGAVSPVLGAGSWYANQQANKLDLPSRRIRARGFQRALDEKVDKAGGSRIGGFVRTTGGGVTHRTGALVQGIRMPRPYRRSYP